LERKKERKSFDIQDKENKEFKDAQIFFDDLPIERIFEYMKVQGGNVKAAFDLLLTCEESVLVEIVNSWEDVALLTRLMALKKFKEKRAALHLECGSSSSRSIDSGWSSNPNLHSVHPVGVQAPTAGNGISLIYVQMPTIIHTNIF